MSNYTKNEIAVIDKKTEIDIKHVAWLSLSTQSQQAYQSDYNIFFKFTGKSAKDTTAEDILKYIEHLEKVGYKNTSINRKIASLSKLFKIYVMAGEIKNNPVEILKQLKPMSRKVSKEIKISVNLTDIKKAIKSRKKDTEQEKKLILIVRLLVKTGLRISEFINIKEKDVETFKNKTKIIRIVGKGKKERFIYLEKSFYDEIKKTYDNNNIEYLFYNMEGNKYCRKLLWAQMRDFFEKRISKKVHPHMLRHIYITHKISVEKKDIKAVSLYVGHSSSSITLDMYVDTALNDKESEIDI